jgi:hypothetical protein
MNAGSQPYKTRVWWDNGEVVFIRWTEKALVFSWGDVRETAVHIPRGAVTRLVQKGVLRVEGEAPTWIQPNFSGAQVVPVSPATPVVPIPAPVEAEKPRSALLRSERFSAISRLIRKLAGSEHAPAQTG